MQKSAHVCVMCYDFMYAFTHVRNVSCIDAVANLICM